LTIRLSEKAKDRAAWALFVLALVFVIAILGYGALLIAGAD
jgi:diacylglycerol kinase